MDHAVALVAVLDELLPRMISPSGRRPLSKQDGQWDTCAAAVAVPYDERAGVNGSVPRIQQSPPCRPWT